MKVSEIKNVSDLVDYLKPYFSNKTQIKSRDIAYLLGGLDDLPSGIDATLAVRPEYEPVEGNPYWEIYKISDYSGSILVRVSYAYSSWDEYYSDDCITIVEPYERTITDYRPVGSADA
jgi:hypothetical protein